MRLGSATLAILALIGHGGFAIGLALPADLTQTGLTVSRLPERGLTERQDPVSDATRRLLDRLRKLINAR